MDILASFAFVPSPHILSCVRVLPAVVRHLVTRANLANCGTLGYGHETVAAHWIAPAFRTPASYLELGKIVSAESLDCFDTEEFCD